MHNIATNIQKIRNEIETLLLSLGRTKDDCTLVAVTKTHPVESIDIALRSGIQHIGENKVQEALRKLPMLREQYEGFHFLGHLQSNKINQLLSLKPLLIHSKIGRASCRERV